MKEELLFCPLGGSGEIGMNMNLFAYGKPESQKWIMVDIGVTFADDSLPGIDLIYPDPGFIIDKKDDLLGIVLTHAHEDHIGAIAHIWPQIKCKIYSTPFTAVLIKEKFKEKRIDIGNHLKIVDLNGTINLDPFKIEFITLTHSILEPNGLRIETPAGVILHTGDWKVDPNPLIGGKINSDRLKEIGNEGVLAMICDSTNVFSVGKSGSELDVRNSILNIMQRLKKRIIVTSLGDYRKNDKNLSYKSKSLHQLILRIKNEANIGIHPSYFSFLNPDQIEKEVKRLKNIINENVLNSRNHYLRFSIPQTYQSLIELGIKKDFTMGYQDALGFRAGICSPFYFFDLNADRVTELQIIPFAYMEGVLRDYMNLNIENAIDKIKVLKNEVKDVNGCFVGIWHNESLSDQARWKGWRKVYESSFSSS